MRVLDLLKRYRGILAVYCAMMLTVLDGTIVNVALPTLTQELGVQPSQTIWIVNAYQLVITMSLLSFAALGDIYSYRRIFLIGVVTFTIASGACALSASLPLLVTCRVIQGLGAACIMSVNVALVRMIYPPDKLGRGMGFNAMVVSLSTVAGPTLAGAILAITTWHWLFLINVPIGVAAYFMGRKFLPDNDRREGPRDHFDKVSAVECAALLFLFVSVLEDFTKNTDWRLVLGEMVAMIVVGYVFVRRQRNFAYPLLPTDLLRIPLFSMSICTSVASFAAQMLAMVSLPFLLNSLGCDALKIGLLISPWPIGVMIAAPVAGRIVERVHGGLLGAIGMAVFATGMLLLYLLPQGCETWDIVWRMAVCGIGFGIFQTPNNVTIASAAPRHRSGAAGGMQGSARVLGQTIGTTLVAVVLRLIPVNGPHYCLLVAMSIAILAAVLSSLRLTQHSSYQDQKRR